MKRTLKHSRLDSKVIEMFKKSTSSALDAEVAAKVILYVHSENKKKLAIAIIKIAVEERRRQEKARLAASGLYIDILITVSGKFFDAILIFVRAAKPNTPHTCTTDTRTLTVNCCNLVTHKAHTHTHTDRDTRKITRTKLNIAQ